MLEFDQQLKAAQQRLEGIQQCTWDSPELVEELRNAAIAELSATLDQLQAQNQELLATRRTLKQERQRYQALFNSPIEGYLVTNERGIIQEGNQVIATLLNTSKASLTGNPLDTYVAQADLGRFRIRLNLLSSQQLKDWEVTLQPRQGQPFPASLSTCSDRSVELGSWRWLIRDLRERKQTEATRKQLTEAQKRNEFYHDLLEQISFEIRTLLHLILLSVGQLERYSYKEAKQKQIYQSISSSVESAVELLEKIEVLHLAEDKLQTSSNPLPDRAPLS